MIIKISFPPSSPGIGRILKAARFALIRAAISNNAVIRVPTPTSDVTTSSTIVVRPMGPDMASMPSLPVISHFKELKTDFTSDTL